MVIVLGLTIAALLLLFYTYIGYPLLITLLAKIKPLPYRRDPITPPVTLIIPAHNEREFIAKKLQNTLKLDYPRERLQVIVSDDGSTDGTADIVRGFQGEGIVLSSAARGGKPTAVNRAARLATGEIIVISDANVMCAPDALCQVVASFADSSIGSVVGRKRVVTTESDLSKSDGLYWKYEALIQSSESKVHSTFSVSGHLQATRAVLFPVIPPGTILDDQYIGLSVLNQGYRVIVEPSAVCWEGSSAAMGGEVARRRRITAGRFALLNMLGRQFHNIGPWLKFQLISHKVLRLFIPVYMLVALVGNAFLVFGPRWFGQANPLLWSLMTALLIAQIAFYAAALTGAVAERLGRRSKILYLPYFLVSTNLASLSGLFSYLSSGTQVTWQRVQREEA